MMALTVGIHLHDVEGVNKITVSHAVAEDGRVIAWVNVAGLDIFCNSQASAEGVADALKAALATPRQYLKKVTA